MVDLIEMDDDRRFTKNELALLMSQAIPHYQTGNMVLCKYLYKNKPLQYFQEIMFKPCQTMETYLKDNSGDPMSPINGTLNGLFFMASVKKSSTSGEPKKYSQFGNTRLTVPIEVLFDVQSFNLYFADFFCMKSKEHFVTLVLTRQNSAADDFCKDRLTKLNVYNNSFLSYDLHTNSFRVPDCRWFTVEVFYTEDVPISDMLTRGGEFTKVIPFGKGKSTKNGVKKNPMCALCNVFHFNSQGKHGDNLKKELLSIYHKLDYLNIA